uniref:Lipoprotein n=1 Tax=uncultured bacterium A1Q1_fos_1815 TaxID=1256553 RepID=L7VVR2_9BACT|nr:putative protein-signal peptide and transmembrane prediction [uncultured bacterium A1Q1_fos_1815]
MLNKSASRRRFLACGLLMGAVLGSSSGCVRLAANLVHAFKGNDVPAEFVGLEGKKIAVLCSTDEGVSTDVNGIVVARFVRELLQSKIEKVSVASEQEVDQWVLSQNTDVRDYAAIGKGLDVDYVIAIDMSNLTFKNGSTLYRGNCDLTVSVYDINKEGRVAFRKHVSQFMYPTMAGAPTTDMSETNFRRIYLTRVAHRAARHFFPYELGADVAADATLLSY